MILVKMSIEMFVISVSDMAIFGSGAGLVEVCVGWSSVCRVRHNTEVVRRNHCFNARIVHPSKLVAYMES